MSDPTAEPTEFASTPPNEIEPWQRVHIVSPFVRAGRALIPIAFILLSSTRSGSASGELVNVGIHVVIVAVLLAFGFLQWIVTRWRIEDGTLRIETGLIRRQSLRFPLDQIQAVDTVRSGLARMFGVSELRLRMASQTGDEGRLAYLQYQHAETVRARLLALAHGVHEHAPQPPEQVLLSVNSGRLVVSILLSQFGLVIEVLTLALLFMVVISPTQALSFVSGSFAFFFAFAVGAWRRFNSGFHLTIAEAPDGLRLRSGLIETTAETIPRGRIQAVRMSEPLIWRLFGWCRLEVSVAGSQKRKGENKAEGKSVRTVLPVADKQQVAWLLSRLVPDAPPGPLLAAPRRARFKAPLSFHFLAWARNDRCVVETHGRLERVTVWIPLAKVQSLRVLQGPVQRRCRLAGIHLDVAGKDMYAKLTDRDQNEVPAVVEELIEKCRLERARAGRDNTDMQPVISQ